MKMQKGNGILPNPRTFYSIADFYTIIELFHSVAELFLVFIVNDIIVLIVLNCVNYFKSLS